MTDCPVLHDPGIAHLQDQIAALRTFDFSRVRHGPMPELDALSAAIVGTIGDCFGEDSASCRRFLPAAALAPAPVGPDDAGSRLRQAVRGNVQRAIALLEEAKCVLHERAREPALPEAPAGPSRRVLVVHGEDDGAYLRVVLFLAGTGLEAVSLARPTRGGPLVGMIEACHDAGFAVVLPAPGALPLTGPHTRQHELLELGYLMGRLGRTHVCVFTRGTPDLPGELAGGVWHIMGRTQDWQPVLGRALRAAGYAVDRDAVLRS